MLQHWYFSLRGTHVPFHQPTFKVLFAKHPAVHEILCNFKAAVQDWSDSVPAKCTCAILRQFPSCCLVPLSAESHLVLDGAKLAPYLSSSIGAIASGSLNNKFFPNYSKCETQFQTAFLNWSKSNSVPTTSPKWIHLCFLELWNQHRQHLADHISTTSIKGLQQLFPDCIFHNEDKHASSLRIYCPCLYHACLTKTFADPQIFQPTGETPSVVLRITVQHLRNTFSSRYPWAIGTGQMLPSAYVLPKSKKQFQSGRPIVSFYKAPFRPMLTALAKLLYQLIPQACPQHFAVGDVYHLLTT